MNILFTTLFSFPQLKFKGVTEYSDEDIMKVRNEWAAYVGNLITQLRK